MLFFGVVSLCLFHPILSGQLLAGRDLIRLTVPSRWLAANIWSDGSLPLWNSASGLGTPLMADPVAGAFDPFTLLFFLPLKPLFVGTLLVWLRYVLAGAAMYRYLRLSDRSLLAAAGGGLFYLFSGMTIGSWTSLPWAGCWMYVPLVLAIPRSGGTPAGRGIAAGAAFTLMLTGGMIEPTLFTFLLWFMEVGVVARSRAKEMFACLAAAAGFSLFQVLPTVELYLSSDRLGGLPHGFAFDYSLSPLEILGLIFPITFFGEHGGPSPPGMYPFSHPMFFSTYIGAALFPLLVFGVGRGNRRFVFTAVVGILLSLGRYLPGMESLLAAAPWITSFGYPVKFVFFLPPAVANLGASGLDGFPRVGESPRATAILVAAALMGSLAALAVLWPDPAHAQLWLAFNSRLLEGAQISFAMFLAGCVLLFASDRAPRLIAVLFIIVASFDLNVAARRALVFEPASIADPPALRTAIPDTWPRIIATAEVSFPDARKTSTQRVRDLLDMNSGVPHGVRYVEEYGSFRRRAWTHWWERHVANDASDGRRALAAVGVRYFLCDEPLFAYADSTGWRRESRSESIALFRNPDALPELRFYAQVEAPSETALLSRGTGEVSCIEHARDGRLRARLKTSGPGWLYRVECFAPGWSVVIGENAWSTEPAALPGQIVRLDHAVDNALEYSYRPSLFFLGLTVSFFASMLAIVVLYRARTGRSHFDLAMERHVSRRTNRNS